MSTKIRLAAALALIVSMFSATMGASAHHDGGPDYHPIEREEFEDVWARTDLPVQELELPRSWIWSPAAHSPLISEDYAEGDEGEREVQYFDKSRMEMPTEGDADTEDTDSPWFITQGRLAFELMTGELQLGDETFEQHHPSHRSAAGDPEDETAPTYEAMGELMDEEPRDGENVIVEYANRDGDTVEDSDRFAHYGVTDVEGDWQDVDGIDKNIASVFWEFMNSETTIYDVEEDEFVEDDLFLNAFYAVGYPLTDAFWADVTVDGESEEVLIQCFERRCLTFTPENPDGWEVESGNIGQHYYDWRYHEIDEPLPPEPVLSLELAQDEDENVVGTEHEFTATLTEDDDPLNFAEEDVAVEVERDGSDVDFGDNDLDIEVDDNVATISYTGPEDPEVDTINVDVDVDGEVVVGEPTLTKTWLTQSDFFNCDTVVESDNGTIQNAIEQAAEDDIICAEPGTYAESIIVDVDGVTLLALEGPDDTTINSDIDGVGEAGTPGVVGINADNVVLDGFTIDNVDNFDDDQSRAVRVNSSVDGVTIQNNIMVNSFRGVQGDWDGQGGDNITIADNTFNTALGVAGTEEMDGLVITGNTFNTTVEGIGLGEGLTNWTIEGNPFSSSDGDYVRDYRDSPDQSDLEDIIDDNEFENEVHVQGNAIVDQ